MILIYETGSPNPPHQIRCEASCRIGAEIEQLGAEGGEIDMPKGEKWGGGVPQTTGRSVERRKLPERGPGRSPG